MTTTRYTIGLDFGTNSVRALLVDTGSGVEIGVGVFNYEEGEAGVVVGRDPNMARQHPADYRKGLQQAIRAAIKQARHVKGFSPDKIIGLGVDTTGSTPIPVNAEGTPLALIPAFARNPDAMAWLWKDHTGHAEAAEITTLAKKIRPQYLAKCGGTYSSEWFWSKILRCKRIAPTVFKAAFTWVEHADWIPALLTGTDHPSRIKRGICAAGHKAMFNPAWGGYPDARFLGKLDPALAALRKTLPDRAYTVADAAGSLTEEWAERLGLPSGIPVAVGAFDAHLGAVGSGIKPGTFVKIIGTSTCDIAVSPLSKRLPDIPGLCGIVPESVLPGQYGLEAGQSAVGDTFNWFVKKVRPEGQGHDELQAEGLTLRPGESGLLALDWNNGNRTILVDQRLTGMVVGTTLHTTPAELYRALVEATAFGARTIVERFEEYGVSIKRVVNCGGISVKNALAMQIYADVLNRPLEISRSTQTCALGSAMCGAVVAGRKAGGHDNFAQAARSMTSMHGTKFTPIQKNVKTYARLYALYRRLHDLFGTRQYAANQFTFMKELLKIRDEARHEAS
jgi:L-ribulokinase